MTLRAVDIVTSQQDLRKDINRQARAYQRAAVTKNSPTSEQIKNKEGIGVQFGGNLGAYRI